jgi:phosphatidylserine decarboxylase
MACAEANRYHDIMATTSAPPNAPPLEAAPIRGVQPGGGGVCVRLEQAWGRWRRFWLRRLRPGYVREMAALRQGHCPDCSHDVLDPRDLKHCRNVCGYHFGEQDDPFRKPHPLRLARAGLAEVLFFSLLLGPLTGLLIGLALWQPWFYVPAAAVAALWVFIFSFFRDPQRIIPPDTGAVLSPADGTVREVGDVAEPDFPGGRAFLVSIFLSVFNVHVNRIPRGAKVTRLVYYPGCFLDARRPECGVRNEQFWIDLEDASTGIPLRVKQVAGAIARRIVCWLRPGEEVHAGDRLGMIKFGSRTDLLLPVEAVGEVLVRVGDKVKGGSTVLLRLSEPRRERRD